MPIFYLHLHECGTILADEEGMELPDVAAARRIAIRAARDVMVGEIMDGRLCLGCAIVIEDADHVEIARIEFRNAIAVSGI